MTMPSKIWICPDTMSEMGSAVQTEPPAEGYPDHSYIRADIAEELARALEAARDILKFYHADHDMVDAALARFRA